MKKLIYIATLLTLVGTQGRLLADEQAGGEGTYAFGEQEKSLTPGQEPTQAPPAPVEQDPVRKEDIVAEMPEQPKTEQPKTEPAPILPPVEEPKTEQPQAVPVEEPAMK